MSISENLNHLFEANHYDILREKAISLSIDNLRKEYHDFLKSGEKERIVFKADFVQRRSPRSFLIYVESTFTEVDYETLEPELSNIFEANRIKRDEARVEDEWRVIEEVPPLLTENLIDFRSEFPGDVVEVYKKFELLQGNGNPLHALIINRFIDSEKKYTKTDLAEIWTVKKLGPTKIPITALDNKRTELIPYPTLVKVA